MKMSITRYYNSTNFITGMRALAILMVYLIHFGELGLRNIDAYSKIFVDWGQYGVEVFFVISGFTIFYQFFESKYSFKKFLFIRISRISIPYYPLLMLILIYLGLGGPQFDPWASMVNHGTVSLINNVIFHILYLSPYKLNFANSIVGVEWTLGIEVFFYIFFAILIVLGFFRFNMASFFIFFILSFMVSWYLPGLGEKYSMDPLFIHFLPFSYGAMFVLGGGAYFFRKKLELLLSNNVLSVLSNISLVLIPLITLKVLFIPEARDDFFMQFYFSGAAFFAIIVIRDEAIFSKILTNKVIIYIGSISYSFYLLHFVLLGIFGRHLHSWLLFIIILASSSIWYWFFEKILYGRAKIMINKRVE